MKGNMVCSLLPTSYNIGIMPHLSSECYQNKITIGPMKGMYARDFYYDEYTTVWNEMAGIDWTDHDILLCGNSTPLAF